MRKVSERAPPEFVAVAIALAQQNRRRGIAIRDAFNVHGQLESLRFKRVKQKIEKLHGKPNQYPGRFTIQNQRVSPKTSGNFRLAEACSTGLAGSAAGGISEIRHHPPSGIATATIANPRLSSPSPADHGLAPTYFAQW